MSQNSDCGCNDYSLLTANTGIASISSANPLLTGQNATAVLTASSSFNGTIVKSIRIKATGPVTAGMIRLFVGTSNASSISLYKEIPVPTTPTLTNTATPTPVLPTFEMVLHGDLKLPTTYKLYASTQNGEVFKIITEALDWKYPSVLPGTCCNFKQETAVIGLGTVSTGNTATDGTGAVAIFTAAASSNNGSFVKSITIKALQSSNENGMIRLYLSPDSSTFSLMQEIVVTQQGQSAFDPSFKMVVDLNMHIKPGYVIGATTQLSQSFALTVEAVQWSYPIS